MTGWLVLKRSATSWPSLKDRGATTWGFEAWAGGSGRTDDRALPVAGCGVAVIGSSTGWGTGVGSTTGAARGCGAGAGPAASGGAT